MKKKTYRILTMIPFAKPVMMLLGKSEFMYCSPGLADGTFEPIFEYAQKHPDIVITEKLGHKILSQAAKQK